MKPSEKILLAVVGGVVVGWLLTSSRVIPPANFITRVNPDSAWIYHAALFPR